MTSQEKQAFILLKCIIFNFHGIDEDEQELLYEAADKLDADKELQWAHEFIAKDYYNAFERAQKFLDPIMIKLEKEKRLDYLNQVWDANYKKGYISEMEATAMIKLAQDWQIESELIDIIKQ